MSPRLAGSSLPSRDQVPVGAMDGLAGLDNRHGGQHILGSKRLPGEIPAHLAPIGLVGLGFVEADDARLERLRLGIGSPGGEPSGQGSRNNRTED